MLYISEINLENNLETLMNIVRNLHNVSHALQIIDILLEVKGGNYDN